MRWKDGRRSGNVEDRRGTKISGKAKGGGIGLLVLVLVGLFFGIDPSLILQLGGNVTGPAVQESQYVPTEAENELADFVSVVLADTEDTWGALFNQAGGSYEEPTLVLFTGAVKSACGFAQAAMGPFYCPADRKVYIDLSFYQDLRTKMGAPGDFAQAYVVAHEIGHHVQNLLGYTDHVHGQRGKVSKEEYNRLSVRLELQADFLAGVRRFRTRGSSGKLNIALDAMPTRDTVVVNDAGSDPLMAARRAEAGSATGSAASTHRSRSSRCRR